MGDGKEGRDNNNKKKNQRKNKKQKQKQNKTKKKRKKTKKEKEKDDERSLSAIFIKTGKIKDIYTYLHIFISHKYCALPFKPIERFCPLFVN